MRFSGGTQALRSRGPVRAGALMYRLSDLDAYRRSDLDSLPPVIFRNGSMAASIPITPVHLAAYVPSGSAHLKRQLFHHPMPSPPTDGGHFGSKTSSDGGSGRESALNPRLVRQIGRHYCREET